MESLNRVTFDVNDFLDRLLLRPLAELYRATIPPGIRDRVTDVVANMKEPDILANNLMQGQFDKAGTTIARLGINTTVGIGGMWDVADSWCDLHQQTGDFGQTLAVWGFSEGAYHVLPLYGPSNVRDEIGLTVDTLLSPWQYLTLMGGLTTFYRFEAANFTATTIVRREKHIESLDTLRQGSIDYYAQMRSAYRQYRAKQIGVDATPKMSTIDDGEQQQ